jgi:hypothetical protein
MPDQQQRQPPQDAPWAPKQSPFGDGPKDLREGKPDTNSILKKIRTIAPESAKRYKQRTGQ